MFPSCLHVNKATQQLKTGYVLFRSATSVRAEIFLERCISPWGGENSSCVTGVVHAAVARTITATRWESHEPLRPSAWQTALLLMESKILKGMKCFAEFKMNLLTSLKSAGRQPVVTINLQLICSSVQARFPWYCHQSVIYIQTTTAFSFLWLSIVI